jgi:hypothetical protein
VVVTAAYGGLSVRRCAGVELVTEHNLVLFFGRDTTPVMPLSSRAPAGSAGPRPNSVVTEISNLTGRHRFRRRLKAGLSNPRSGP